MAAMLLRVLGCVMFSASMALVLFALVRDIRELPPPALRAMLAAIPATGFGALMLWALSAALGE